MRGGREAPNVFPTGRRNRYVGAELENIKVSL